MLVTQRQLAWHANRKILRYAILQERRNDKAHDK